MPDEKYLIPNPPKPEPTAPRPHPESNRVAVSAVIISVVSALISLASASFTGWQSYHTRKLAEQAQGPFIEVMGAQFINRNNLKITFRNNGRTTAYNLHNLPEARYCRLVVDRVSNKPAVSTVFVDSLGDFGHPDAPVGKDFESTAFIRDADALRQFFGFNYQEDMFVQLRGSFKYEDGLHNVYHSPWCYQVFQPYKSLKPGWSACYDVE